MLPSDPPHRPMILTFSPEKWAKISGWRRVAPTMRELIYLAKGVHTTPAAATAYARAEAPLVMLFLPAGEVLEVSADAREPISDVAREQETRFARDRRFYVEGEAGRGKAPPRL